MPLGPYSPCPGGTGNKIKFCCPELLGELQKIQRMLEGGQYQACLGLVERLEKSNPDKACLLATKALLLRVLGRLEEAAATASAFVTKHPRNPVALAESAMAAALGGDARTAMRDILRALPESMRELNPRVFESMESLGRILLAQGQILAARALAVLELHFRPEDRRPMSLLVQWNAEPSIPLLLKGLVEQRDAPEDAPWKTEFDEAHSLASRARWTEAAQRFADLAERFDGEPVLWQNLAVLRAWIADTPGSVEALRKLATLDSPLEDAAEAEAQAAFLSPDPLGDRLEVSLLRYAVGDAGRLQAAMASAPTITQIPVDPALADDENSPRPKAAFVLSDVAVPEPGTSIGAQNCSRILCQALLYGKQTDREARLELIDVSAPDLHRVKALLAEAAGDALDSEPEQQVIGYISATQEMLTRKWRLPANLSRADFERLMEERVEHSILHAWSQLPLGLLDGKAPQEAAQQPAYRVKLLAAILVLEHWLEQVGGSFDFNRLRSHLGLPALEPIDPRQTPLDDLPPIRWSRVMVDRLSDDALLAAYRRALGISAAAAARKFAREVARRPSLAGCKERPLALEMMARLADDFDESLRYLDEGRRLARQAGQSCARWDLLELPLHAERGDAEELTRVLTHVQDQHLDEPGVAQAVTELLIEIGVLNPDGTPVGLPTAPAAKPSLVVPGQPGAKPGELWTPDSQKPSGDKPKIWTPGAE
jgi:hypothetical protein